MKIIIKESKAKKKLKESIVLDNVPTSLSSGFVKTSFLAELFRFFHLSSFSLHKSKDTFTFNPRVTKRPYEDDESFVIEDDFTPRISLATSIEEATEALNTGNPSEYYYVYASDIESREGDEIPESSLVYLPVQIQKCKEDLSSDGNEYGPEFKMIKYLQNKNVLPKRRSRETMTKYMNRTDAIAYSSPKQLPPEHKAKFRACVPDAGETNEYWSTTNTKMYYLGTHITNSGIVKLSAHGRRILRTIMKEEGYDIP
jgi:hypothetical protein